MKKTYILYADILRIVATVSVICIHICMPLIFGKPQSHPGWWTFNLFLSFSRFSVPIFVMISGMLLLDKSVSFSTPLFFKNRFIKIIIPTIIWSLLYYLGHALQGKTQLSFFNLIKVVLGGGSSSHLWFLYMIIGLYISVPFIRPFIIKGDKRDIQYFLIIWFFFSILIPSLSYFTGITISITNTVFSDYLGYFILGFYIHNYLTITLNKKNCIFLITLFSIGFFTTLFGTYFITIERIMMYDQLWFYQYTTMNSFIMSVTIFIFFKMLNYSHLYIYQTKIHNISQLTFGIYLVHAIVLYGVTMFCQVLPFRDLLNLTSISVIFQTLIVFLISMLLTKIIKTFPLIKHMIP
jgi:surface polysaccharide O-acyltransferase-like enzyme